MIDEYIRRWVIKALNDISVAQHEINLPENEMITDAVCFHCLQAVEIRYPEEFYIPTFQEARECFEIASNVKDFILKKFGIKEEAMKYAK